MTDQPYILNPEAVGDPDQMPVVWLPPDLREAVRNNARLAALHEAGVCTGGYSCDVPVHVHGCYQDAGNCDEPDDELAHPKADRS